MQADLSMAGEVSSLKKTVRLYLGKLSHVFGRPGKTQFSVKPTIQHPVENLTLQNGCLFELYRGQPGREYLPLVSGIEVVNKISLAELNEQLCQYRFALNATPDATWKYFFQELFVSVTARLDPKTLVIVCTPQALEATYQTIRDAMLIANRWYAEEREQLITLVAAQDAQRRALAELEENRKQGLKAQFDGLEL